MTILGKKLATLALAGTLFVTTSTMALAEAQTYKMDPTHTAITFHINHFGFSTPSGKFMNVDGTVTLDEENPANSKVEVTIPVDMIDTGVPALDDHLKTADFFDVEQFPTAKFVSTKVDVTGEKTAKVAGNLTIHGVTKPATLDVTLNQIAENMFKKQTAGFTASTTIKRSDFGMTTYLPGLADEVKIDIESEANL